MCLAVPSRIVALNGLLATVEAFGERREVSLMLLAEEVEIGDYLIIQAGGFAHQRVEPEAAEATLRLLSEVLAHNIT
jgi:hydrogenase expression/formation protein HypC